MDETLFSRQIMRELELTYKEAPVTVINGARQVGKSTLMRRFLEGKNARILNLDEAAIMEAAQTDPDGFVRQFPEGTLAIDEVQRAPELIMAIKAALEIDRRPGRFVLTGSANLLSLKGAQESLAGRAQSVRMYGLTVGEKLGIPEDFATFAWGLGEESKLPQPQPRTRAEYLEIATATGFPGIQKRPANRQKRWFQDYLESIFSKDVSAITGLHYPHRLPQLFSLLARENASEFVAAVTARKIDVPERSLPSYVDALHKVFLIDYLPAWSTNLAKRVISRPKIIVSDSGLALNMCGVNLEALQQDVSASVVGGLMEGFVAAQLMAQKTWSATDYQLYHYRDRLGNEVDIILENDYRQVVGVEVKAAMSLTAKDFSGLTFLRDTLGDAFHAGIVLYTGEHALSFGPKLWALPLSTLWDHQ